MLFTESLSPNKPSALAHSFGFSSLIVPQDNLVTSLKANSVNGRAAAPEQCSHGHHSTRFPPTKPCRSAGPGGEELHMLSAFVEAPSTGERHTHSQAVWTRPITPSRAHEGDHRQQPVLGREPREAASGATCRVESNPP